MRGAPKLKFLSETKNEETEAENQNAERNYSAVVIMTYIFHPCQSYTQHFVLSGPLVADCGPLK